jgi:hypothetical protein
MPRCYWKDCTLKRYAWLVPVASAGGCCSCESVYTRSECDTQKQNSQNERNQGSDTLITTPCPSLHTVVYVPISALSPWLLLRLRGAASTGYVPLQRSDRVWYQDGWRCFT